MSSQSYALPIPNAEGLLPGPVQLVLRTNASPGSFEFSGINCRLLPVRSRGGLAVSKHDQDMVTQQSMGVWESNVGKRDA
jgi:hypothetical protein